jgi:eukaryotic-like serine/threonine-protein kinase
LLGRGGMASVYLAHDAELDRAVAIKVLASQFSADEEFTSRFRREAQTAAALAHPNIVQVFDTGEDEDQLFIVMELVEGEGLDEVVAREGALAPDVVFHIADQACAAIEYAHQQGVIHRDVKPANLLIRERDQLLKVADFGIARAGQATQLTQVGTILGTLNYLAPEQARGEDVAPQADIYSLGAVLYELFTGEPPRRFENVAQLATLGEEAPRPVRELAPSVPPYAESAVMRCLARNPLYRPASAGELARELRGDADSGAVTVPLGGATSSGEPTVAIQRRSFARERPAWLPLAVVVALIAAVLILAVLALGGEGEESPAPAERIQPSDQPIEQARNIQEWLREHTESGG